MTVGLVVRVPNRGAVLSCDSRISCESSGLIYSDAEQKWAEFGSVVACFAGTPGGLWGELRADPPKRWADFLRRSTDVDAADHGRDYEILAYDRTKGRILHTDEKGWAIPIAGLHAAIGCGGAFALGVLDSAKAPETLEEAALLAERAIRAACRRNVFCGGRVRVVVIPGRRGALDVR